MKTLGEFLQRLEDDPVFENEAQAYNNGDELMAFVEREGYDFTLEQLTTAFKQRANMPPEADDPPPAPPDVSAPAPPKPEVTALPASPAAFPLGETSPALLNQGGDDVPREQSGQESHQLPGVISPANLEEKATAGLFRSGGGRHRGFSVQRLKSVPGEDS
jgi:hypothetical protein